MTLLRTAIERFGPTCFKLFLRTGFQPFHEIPNLLWFAFCHGRLPRKGRRNIIDLGFRNKYDTGGIFLSPFVDKETVKHFVRALAPKVAIPETYEVITEESDLVTLDLQRPYVIKPTHGSDRVVLKPDGGALTEEEIARLRQWLKWNHYRTGGEIQYRHLAPKLMAEELIGDIGDPPPVYRLECFEGRFLLGTAIWDRFTGVKTAFFDRKGEPIELVYHSRLLGATARPFDGSWPRPDQYPKLVDLAETLASPFRYCRVDLFFVGGKIYFGEYNFSPNNILFSRKPQQICEVDSL
jgi:hypothetical protein